MKDYSSIARKDKSVFISVVVDVVVFVVVVVVVVIVVVVVEVVFPGRIHRATVKQVIARTFLIFS